MIYAQPDTEFIAILSGGPTGLVGTLTAQIERADGTTHTAADDAGIVEIEPGIYSVSRTAPDDAGTYVVVWDNGGTLASEELVVTYSLPAAPLPGSMLVTLAKYKEAIGETSNANDSKHTEAIEDASQAIINEAERNFAEPQTVSSTRTYLYDGSGILEIDDCALPTVVTFSGLGVSAGQWYARQEGPVGIPVYSYLELPTFVPGGGEMGFTRNLDTYLEHYVQREVAVSVTAVFGWPSVPDVVQRATIITAASLEAENLGFSAGLAAKSVAEVAENYLQNEASTGDVIPRKAQVLLAPYNRTIL